MKKTFTILIAAIAAILMMAQPGKVMGQTKAAEVTWDFSSTNNFLTTYPGSTHPGTGNSNNLETFYYFDGTTFVASGTNRYFNSGYFMLGKNGATLQLPTFSFPVKKIVVVGNSGASDKTTQNIYVGSTAVSTETTGSKGTNTYVINSSYQASGTTYVLKVTNAYNSQITSIQIYRAYNVSYNAGTGSGNMADDNTYAQGDEVTLLSNSFTAPGANYTFSSWLVKDADNNTLTVTNNKFTMPASNVTVTAQWVSSGPTPLATPTNFSATPGNEQASFSWDAVANASSYTISYTPAGGSETTTAVEGGSTTNKTITGLTNNIAYTCKIKAVGDGTNYSDSDYTSTITVTPTGATLYTVTVTSPITGGAVTAEPATAEEGATITLTATPAAGYTFNNIASNWSVTPSVTITPGANTNTATFSMPAANVTAVSTTFTPIAVTLNAGNGTVNGETTDTWNVSINEGNLPDAEAPCETWSFEGWSTAAVTTETTERPTTFVETAYVPTSATTLYAVYKRVEGTSFDNTQGGDFQIYAAVTVNDNTTTYYAKGSVNNSGKIGSTTTASEATTYTFEQPDGYNAGEYAIKTGSDYITYSSSTNFGTQSNAYKWTISEGNNGSWRITSGTTDRGFVFRAGSYNLFGGYSTNNITTTGTEYWDVEIGGGSTTYYCSTADCTEPLAAPTITLSSGTYTEVKTTTITYDNTEATIRYTIGTNPADPTSESTVYTLGTNIEINESCVLKAKAFLGEQESPVATASYTINLPQVFATIDDFKAAFSATSDEEVTITGPLTVVYQHGINTYVQDATGGLLIYDTDSKVTGTYTNGQTVSNVKGKYVKYNGLVEFVPTEDLPTPGTGTAVEPVDITSLTASNYATYESRLVRLTNATFAAGTTYTSGNTGSNLNMTDGSNNTVVLRNGFNTLAGSITNGDKANVTGFATFYSKNTTTNYQLFPRDNNDVQMILETMEIDDEMTIDFAAVVKENEIVEIADGGILTVSGTLTNNGGSEGGILVDEGGQLICSNSVAVSMAKETEAWDATNNEGWYAISSPVNGISVADFVKGDDHNVYSYIEQYNYWNEYRATSTDYGCSSFTTLTNGRGYLYRSTAEDVMFTGNSNVGTVNYTLSYANENDNFKGFNLIGNPFTHDIYKNDIAQAEGDLPAINTNNLAYGYYRLGTDGTWTGTIGYQNPIKAGEAVLVKATVGFNLTITNTNNPAAEFTESSKSGNDNIVFTVKNSKYTDVAYAMFNEGVGLNKIDHYNDDIQMLYISQNDADYAIATMPDDTRVINLGFEAKTMSQYSISLKAQGNFSYMHLYDKLTGEDVDMLIEDSYSFIGTPNDRKDRFVLRLTYNASIEEVEANAVFVYQSGSDIIVNGEGELQVFDMMGRKVMTQHINGVETINMNANGVFIFKMNGMTQKIVVR